MKIEVNEHKKIITIWFNNRENPKANLPKELEEKIEKYEKEKYMICMYQSGCEDIKQNLLNLIMTNCK